MLRAAFQVLGEIGIHVEMVTLLFGNESCAPGTPRSRLAGKDLLAPSMSALLPDPHLNTREARAIAAAAITCLQAATKEWMRLGAGLDQFDLDDAAVQVIRY